MKKHKILITEILCIFICMVFFGCGDKREDYFSRDSGEYSSQSTEDTETVKQTKVICVYVCGEVNSPGVYQLKRGCRISEAIEMAGGMTDKASTTFWNLAEKLNDGQMIYVPSNDEAMENKANETEHKKETDDEKININTASKEELMTISGIGESKAEAIIQFRNDNGSFKTTEDIKQVSGIGDAIFSKIKDFITI